MLLVGATLTFVSVMGQEYPLKDWLLWRYLGVALCCAVWSITCLSLGHVLLTKLTPKTLPLLEWVTLSFALGALAFELGFFVVGLAQGYRSWVFPLYPAVLLLLTGRATFRYYSRVWRGLRTRDLRVRLSLPGALIAGAGCFGLVLVSVSLLTPAHIGYDALWYHLPIAEHYVASGGIGRFAEGWMPGTNPHMGSILYAWAFLVPYGTAFDRNVLAVGLEGTHLLWTLVGVAPLVRRLVPRARGHLTWVYYFCFPSVFLCDFTGGADHLAALWTIPVYLTLFRLMDTFTVGRSILLAAHLAGLFLTKLSALPTMAFPLIAFLGLVIYRSLRPALSPEGRRSRGLPALGALAAAVTGLVLTTPYWLRNAIQHGNPVYPNLSSVFPSRPWAPDAEAIFTRWKLQDLSAPPHNWEGFLESLETTITFSFKTHDSFSYTGNTPIFGSLFTLLLVTLIVLRPHRRLVVALLGAHVTIFGWYWLSHQERYLHTPLPLLVACTAAMALRVWRSGWLPRAGLAGLVSLQMAWGSDVFLFPTHHYWFDHFIRLANSGFKKDHSPRENWGSNEPFAFAASKTEKNAKILLHEYHVHLGLERASISDFLQWQFGIRYADLKTPAAIREKLSNLGATHLMWRYRHSETTDSLASDILFHSWATSEPSNIEAHGNWRVAPMPSETASSTETTYTFVMGCGRRYEAGLYPTEDLRLVEFLRPQQSAYPPAEISLTDTNEGELLARAQFVAVDPECPAAKARRFGAQFETLLRRGDYVVHQRRAAAPQVPQQ